MSKHLRFGRLLGLLAIMLTLSFAWAQGQNLSSLKVLSHFKITADQNGELYGDLVGAVDEGARTVTIEIPYRYNVGQYDDIAGVNLTASFKSSLYSNVFYGKGLQPDLDDLTPGGWRDLHQLGQGLGTIPNAPYIEADLDIQAVDGFLTVEAENHSFVHYVLDFKWGAVQSTAKAFTITSFKYNKSWAPCAGYVETLPVISYSVSPIVSNAATITVNVPYGATLSELKFDISPYASAYYGASAPGTQILPAGDPDVSQTIHLTLATGLTDGQKIRVYSQAYQTTGTGTPTTYTIDIVEGLPSLLDDLITFSINGDVQDVDFDSDLRTQTFEGEIPYSATSWVAGFTVSQYAHVYSTNPNLGPATQLCSTETFTVGTAAGPFTYHFWVQAEKTSEVSEYILTISRADCSTANTLTAISGTWTKANSCGSPYSKTVKGTIGSSTITFEVPYGVSSVTLAAPYTVSALATKAPAVGATLSNGSTVTVTSECGGAKVYTVALTVGAISDAKELTAFGFKASKNEGLGFDWNEVDYIVEPGDAGWDGTLRRITVEVPWVTDLHQLTAYFKASDYSCVFIANTTGPEPQTSDVTVNDHSNRLTYIVRAENGTEERYEVTVVKTPVSTDATIQAFTLEHLHPCPELPQEELMYDVEGVISGLNISVSVPYGFVASADYPYNYTIELGSALADGVEVVAGTGTAVKAPFSDVVSGVMKSMSLSIKVTAEDLSTKTYVITLVPRAENDEAELTKFWFDADLNGGNIGNFDAVGVLDTKTPRHYYVHVPYGTDLEANDLIASFELNNNTNNYPGGAVMTHSEDVQIVQVSGETYNDYHHQVAFTVWAENCVTNEYFVDVIVDPNAGNEVEWVKFVGLKERCAECYTQDTVRLNAVVASVNEDEGTISLVVPHGTILSGFGLSGELSEGATIDVDFEDVASYTLGEPIEFVVTAENGISTKKWTLTITEEAPLTGAQLLSFGFEVENNPTFYEDRWTPTPINEVTYRIDVRVPWGTDLDALVATFTHSPMSCVYINGKEYTASDIQCSGETEVDFTDAVTYTVVAQDGTEQYYNVYVLWDDAKNDKNLTAFKLTDMPYCTGLNISPSTYEIAGVGTNPIEVSVKAGEVVTALHYSFTIDSTASVTVSNGTLTSLGSGKYTGVSSFAGDVTFTVKAQNLTTTAYVVKVKPRPTADISKKQLTKYWFKSSPTNPFAGAAIEGTIDEAEKKVTVWLPWGTEVNSLKASFELNGYTTAPQGGVVMTHSEKDGGVIDKQVVQVSGTTVNDFREPVAYTVIAEDCSTVEYFVTVKITPNSDTGISEFGFAYTDCGCDLKTVIDPYARRIYVTVPSTLDISSLAPSKITVTPAIGNKPAASVSPAVGVKQNWKNGPVKYTVTAPDGVTKADWMVYVTNPKCTDTDILAFSLPGSQVEASDLIAGYSKPVTIDKVNHKITVIIKKSVTNLTALAYTRDLPCGATICCVGGACQDNHVLDFSQGGCHTCVVTAQDQTVTQEWTICVKTIDDVIPVVKTWSVMAMNCTDSVAVQSNELGRVFIVNESAINWVADRTKCTPKYNLWDANESTEMGVKELVDARLGAWATVTAVDTPVYVQTNGLYGGAYWAFAVDQNGNVSCISTERLYLDICDKTVATLCELRDMPDVWRYTLSQEVLVSYEETGVDGINRKSVQAGDCGIVIEDRVAALPATYGQGTGLTGLKGMLDKSDIYLKLIPVCCYTPTKSSTGNVIAPIEMTYDEYLATCYTHSDVYESVLIKVTTPMIASNAYDQGTKWVFDNLDLNTLTAHGQNDWIIQSVFNSPLIGTTIPTAPAYYTGVRTNVDWWGDIYGLFTPRKAADIVPLTAPVITASPNPVEILNVVPGNCASTTVEIYNEGVGNATISALYLDDAAATDGFDLVKPATVPFTLGTWTKETVTINFCPKVAGNKTTYLVVEYGVGKTLRIPVNGTTMLIYPIPFSEKFTSTTPPAAWNSLNMIYDNYGNGLTDGIGYLYGWSWVTPQSARPIWVITPGINLGTAQHPTLTFRFGTYFSSNFRVDVSTDYANWTTVKDWGYHTLGNAVGGTYTVDLTAYKGQIVYIRFYSTSANYFGVDNVVVQEAITTPVISAAPAAGNFGGVQVGATGTLNFSIKNVGVSVLKVKNVSVSGAGFTKTDANTYPFEVTDGPGTWAYAVGANGSSLNFSVNFSPTDIGVKTGKIVVTYGLYSDETLEIPLTGEGLSCATATEVFAGENYAASHNTWWKYTAEKFQIVDITSCDPRNTVTPFAYAFDSYIRVYSDCAGTQIAFNDDMEAACPTNRANSGVQVVMNAGETIYIFWDGIWMNDCATCDDPFYWHINPSYPIDGDVCETAIPLTLPVVNHFGTTVGYGDDYNISPCSPFSNYMDGNDKVYQITTTEEGYLIGNILGAYGSIHVLDVCPKEELEKFHCKAFASGPNGGQFRKKIEAGTYFVIISTWAPPQTVDFLLNMSWESGSAVENSDLMSKLNVYPNPNNGVFTVSVTNAEATDMTIELVNISGQVVYRNEVKAAYSYNEEINAATFAKGVYYLKVNSDKGVKIEKVVVQ